MDAPRRIRIEAQGVSLLAELDDTPTARSIWEALPFDGTASTWGDEVYFEIPVVADLEPGARAEVEVGELGYWPVGRALCIFFGPTPASVDERPRAYSPVNIVGRVLGDATAARRIRDGEPVRVRREKGP